MSRLITTAELKRHTIFELRTLEHALVQNLGGTAAGSCDRAELQLALAEVRAELNRRLAPRPPGF